MTSTPNEHSPTANSSNSVTWRSPSNIAIVKYWGKYGEQLPSNPSISLTLSGAHTETTIAYEQGRGQVDFYFDGERNEAFAKRVRDYVKRVSRELPSLEAMDLRIESGNSFPHSAGIASSASAMSALALCLNSVAASLDGSIHQLSDVKQVSHLARLGSGSAARSVSGPVMLWGETDALDGSSNEYALKVDDVHPVFAGYRDSILIVSDEEKQVKSTAGHALMKGHPYAAQRFETARQRIAVLLEILQSGDVHAFGRMAEKEAMDLHAMMMTSTPPYLLMRPGTISIIEKLHAFRRATGLPAYMTLDAGPNVHLLYPDDIKEEVHDWIDNELLKFCAGGQVLHDAVGKGPKFISS